MGPFQSQILVKCPGHQTNYWKQTPLWPNTTFQWPVNVHLSFRHTILLSSYSASKKAFTKLCLHLLKGTLQTGHLKAKLPCWSFNWSSQSWQSKWEFSQLWKLSSGLSLPWQTLHSSKWIRFSKALCLLEPQDSIAVMFSGGGETLFIAVVWMVKERNFAETLY